MEIIQGRYLKDIRSGKGTLKALQIETTDGQQTVHLPKSIRVIAQQELTLGDSVRIWVSVPHSKSKGDRRGKSKSKSKGKLKKGASKREAIQLIPLSPSLDVSRFDGLDLDSPSLDSPAAEGPATPIKDEKGKAAQKNPQKNPQKKVKKKARKKAQKKAKHGVTVQLCQKKNCCRLGGDDLWQAFEGVSKTAAAAYSFELEAVGCLGGCKRGPNIRLLPDNVKYRSVQPDDIDQILEKHSA